MGAQIETVRAAELDDALEAIFPHDRPRFLHVCELPDGSGWRGMIVGRRGYTFARDVIVSTVQA